MKKHTKDEINEILDKHSRTRLSNRRFCHKHKIGTTTLWRWRKEAQTAAAPAPTSPKVETPTATKASPSSCGTCPTLHMLLAENDHLKKIIGEMILECTGGCCGKCSRCPATKHN